MRKPIIILLLAMGSMSCGASQFFGDLLGESGAIGLVPPVNNPAEIAEVYVIRSKQFMGAGRTATVQVDGQKLFKITVGHYTKFNVAADRFNREHCLDLSYSQKGELIDIINMYCLPGEKHYFLVNGRLKKLTADEGNALIKESTYFELK